MKADDIRNIAEAYNSIYEVTSAPDPKLADKRPVNPQSAQIAKNLFAKPSEIAPSSSVKPVVATAPVSSVKSTPSTPVSPTSTPSPVSPTTPQKTFQQELDDLRKASAQATMAGPSKEAQSLMSGRAKNILGAEKLRAGIEGQQRVEKMKSEIGMSKVEAPKSTPLVSSTSIPTPPPAPKVSSGLSKDQLNQYNRATSALQNPLTSGMARGKVKDTFTKLDPEQQKTFRDYLSTRPKSEQDLYKFLGEQQIGIPLKEPTDRAAANKLKEILPPSEKDKVVIPKSGLQKASYEYEDLYDKVLDYLVNEGGHSEEESKNIMVKNVIKFINN